MAVLKCGYWGINTNQTLPVDEMKDGVKPSKDQFLARNLRDAVTIMDEKDSVARLVLGDAFVDHYVKTRLHEWDEWQNTVTDYERKRYLELV
jgi:glutamine synthetase